MIRPIVKDPIFFWRASAKRNGTAPSKCGTRIKKLQIRLKTFTGRTAQIIQHEIDRCSGILI